MLPDTDLQKTIRASFVPTMWTYDGLGGKVIHWTKDHGNTNDDPSHLVWIVDADGNEISRAKGEAESSGAMAKWLVEGLKAFEKSRKRGVAHLFEPVAEGDDALAAPEKGAVVVWYYASAAEGASTERKAAAARTKALAEGALASKRLEDPLRSLPLRGVDASVDRDGVPASAEMLSHLPRLVIVGAVASADAVAPRVELEASNLTIEAIVAGVRKFAAAK